MRIINNVVCGKTEILLDIRVSYIGLSYLSIGNGYKILISYITSDCLYERAQCLNYYSVQDCFLILFYRQKLLWNTKMIKVMRSIVIYIYNKSIDLNFYLRNYPWDCFINKPITYNWSIFLQYPTAIMMFYKHASIFYM